MFKRDIRQLVNDSPSAAVRKLCETFGIGIAHAEDIIRDLDKYQWHLSHNKDLDEVVKTFLNNNNIVGAVKAIRAKTEWGLFESKLYMEDIQNGSIAWPLPLPGVPA